MSPLFGNATSVDGPAFHPEPNNRGTWSILTTCIITISLCAWTALHLNIPEHRKAKSQWLRKTRWLLIGLIAPEFVAYVAWRQRQEARQVLRRVRVHLGQQPQKTPLKLSLLRWYMQNMPGDRHHGAKLESGPAATVSPRIERPKWTIVHGFYAVMGGFSIDVEGASTSPFLPNDRTRAALTPEGIRFLLQHEPDFLPSITEEDILDKSKADWLKKILVCVQASWFGVNCITRLVQNLPISLLELNAFGHAACALLIYWMWWNKPLDVDEPTLISGRERLRPLLAYMWMSSRIGAQGQKASDVHGGLRDEFDVLWCFQNPIIQDLRCGQSSDERGQDEHKAVHGGKEHKPLPELPEARNFGVAGVMYEPGRQYEGQEKRFRIMKWWLSTRLAHVLGYRRPPGMGVRKTAVEHISRIDIERWRLAYDAIQTYNLSTEVFARDVIPPPLYDDSRIKARITNMASLLGTKASEVWLGFALAGLSYGGLHLLAWDVPFTSRAEQVVWRIAASSVTLTPLIFLPVVLGYETALPTLSRITRLFQGRRKDPNTRNGITWLDPLVICIIIFFMTVGPLLWFSYVLGRVFLLVECFKNVAYLPEGAFQDVSWPGYLPHVN